MDDAHHMRRALALAALGRGNTSPNPLVGAVVVAADGATAGEGFHARAGMPHAEVQALSQAGERARGGTLFVTLEPCDHHGATPPCTEAIIEAGVRRAVVALEDADTRVRGRGVERLRAAGVRVDVGTEHAAAAAQNEAYAHHRTTGRSFVTLKMAASLDGAIAPRAGVRHCLTGPEAAAFVHQLRFEHDAVLVGAHTARVDDPQLTVRPHKPRAVPYLRIVADAHGQLPLDGHLARDAATTPTMVVTTSAMPAHKRAALQQLGVEIVIVAATHDGHVDLDALLAELGRRNIVSVLCEGGPTLAAGMLAGAHVGRVYWLIAPEILGSATAAPAIAAASWMPLTTGLDIGSAVMLGADVLISATPTGRATAHDERAH